MYSLDNLLSITNSSFFCQEKQCRKLKHEVCKSAACVAGLLLSCVDDLRYTPVEAHKQASCHWTSIFAHACALTGSDIPQKHPKWRKQCEAVYPDCGAGSVYDECPTTCLNSRSQPENERALNAICQRGCLAGKFVQMISISVFHNR